MPSPQDSFKDSTKSGKQCPVCDVALILSERQGIEIDYCPECRGVWLDRGELDKIIKHSMQLQNTGAPDIAPDVADSNPDYAGSAPEGDYREESGYREDNREREDNRYREDDRYREESGYRVGNHGGGHGRSRHGHDGGHGHGGGHGRRHGGGHGGGHGRRHGGGHFGRSWLQDLFH